jgi:hypothetical protein
MNKTSQCFIVGLLLLSPGAWAEHPGVEPKADQILKNMSNYLGGLKEFSLQAETTMDQEISGVQVESSSRAEAFVRRPDGNRLTRHLPELHPGAISGTQIQTVRDFKGSIL